jgi:cation diffusion facilitator family transporter
MRRSRRIQPQGAAPQGPGQEGAGQEGARKVVLAALSGNLAIAVTKFVAFALSGSTAMLTEGIHSVVDTGDQLLLLVGQRRAALPANEAHPFGYGMETYFWTFIVALMIFLAGGVVAVWEGWEKLIRPQPVTRPLLSLGVLAASALFEGLSFRTAYREYRQIVRGRDIRLVSFLRVSKDPNVFATLLEDGAALTGLAIAGLGVAGSAVLGWTWMDGLASILIGLLLIAIAAFLANETRSLIAGEAAAPPIVQAVLEALRRLRRLGEPVHVRTLHLGPQTILVTICWRFDGDPDFAAVEKGLAEITAEVRAADPRICDVTFEVPLLPTKPDGLSSGSGSWAGGTAPPDPRARLPGSPG